MVKQVDFHIGARVLCEGEECGRVAKLVVDPYTHRVTDLIVEKGLLFKKDTVVPVDAVEEAAEDIVTLAIPKDKLGGLYAYHEKEYETPPADWKEERYERKDLLHRIMPGGTLPSVPLVSMLVHRAEERISPTKAVIERGLAVFGLDGKIGDVDHVLVDRESGEMKLLVVDRGPFLEDVVIPAELISNVTSERITVNLHKEQVEDLYHYKPRDEVDVLAEVRDRLSRIPVNPDSIKIELDGGVLRLSGVVPNVRIKRRIVGMVSAIEGVLYVEDNLQAAETIEARVVAALRSDPRTDIAGIDVVVRQGIVTLTGQVDSQEIKEAAEEIAAAQEGIVEVINEIEVKPDKDTEYLQFAWAARNYFAENM